MGLLWKQNTIFIGIQRKLKIPEQACCKLQPLSKERVEKRREKSCHLSWYGNQTHGRLAAKWRERGLRERIKKAKMLTKPKLLRKAFLEKR